MARDWILAAILFSGILGLLLLQITSLAGDYDNIDIIDDDFENKFDRFEENTDIASEMWDEASSEEGLSPVGTFELLFKSSFAIISLVFTSVALVGDQMFGFAEYFGVPSKVAFLFFTILLSSLTVIIVFIVVSAVSRRDL